MVSADNISVVFDGEELFSNVSFQIRPKDRIGLTGKNGSGKTTLLRILHGLIKPSSGALSKRPDITSGYLPQQMKVEDNLSILEETLTAFNHIISIENKIKETEKEIASRVDHHTDDYLSLCDSLTDLQQQYSLKGGEKYIAETEQALTGLGFERSSFNKPTNTLSGGWRMRIELAKILLAKPSVLLLDEPTNHLDILSIQWLEQFLKTYPGAVVIVSHDRAFLDNITNRTLEISLGTLYDYNVPYTKYTSLRKERREHQLAAWKNQQKMIEDNERFIERFRYKNTKAVQVQSRIKKLDKLERIEIEEEDNSRINIRFASAPRSGTIVVEAENLSKSFEQNHVLDRIDFMIERGEKVAFIGRNGEGKSTFVKIIMDELEHTGTLKRGHNLNIGYYPQNQDELLDDSLTVFQTIDNVARGEIRSLIRDILGAFLFSGEEIDKKVKVLSGGERSRLALAKLLLEPYNLLILDEPTNHLDMRSKDILKQALQKYDGTLIVVSHDRDFLNGLTDRLFEFRSRKIKEYTGGIYHFLKNKGVSDLNSIENKRTERKSELRKDSSSNKVRYQKRKEIERELRKKQKLIDEKEKRIEELEKKKSEMDLELKKNSNTEPDFFTEYERIVDLIGYEMTSWEEMAVDLDEFKEKKKYNDKAQ